MKKFIIVLSLVMVLVLGMAIAVSAEGETEAAEPVETTVETEVESGAVDEKPADIATPEQLTFVEEAEGKLKFDFDKLFATLVTFLAANLVTILGFAIKMVKTKIDAQNLKNAYDKQVLDLTDKYNKQLDAYSLSINSKLDALDKHIVDRINTTEEVRELKIKQDSVQLQETINALKNSLKV